MSIIGIAGAIGSGKSFTQLVTAFEFANRKERQIIANFPLNIPAVYEYAKQKKYSWLQYLCSAGGISWITAPKNLQSLLIPETVCLLDEAGIFLNSREFAKTPKELLADLAQSRKFGCDLIYCSQFDEQVDRQMRLLTQYWVHCDSISFYDKVLRRPTLKYKKIYTFKASDYANWQSNPIDRTSHFRTRFAYATSYEGGFLNKIDKLVFKCFNSFDRLDMQSLGRQDDRLNTLHRCVLPNDYYFPSSVPPQTAKLGGGKDMFELLCKQIEDIQIIG